MDVDAKIINKKVMVPLRFVAENLGLLVNWDGLTRTVSVEAPKGGIPKAKK